MSSLATRNEEVMAEASAWLARLQGAEVGEADGLAFDAWLAESPANREAYRAALAAWQAFDACADAVLDELAAEQRRTSQRRGATRRWLVGGGMAIAAGLAAVAVLPPVLDRPTLQTYATAKGQHQRITLADGSVVDLNSETRLTVRLARHERRVTLGDGQAIFDIAHDTARPFTVEASGRAVRVLGTQFDVRNRSGDVTVSVARGRVQVRPVASSMSGQAFVLTPGQRLAIGRTGVAQRRRPAGGARLAFRPAGLPGRAAFRGGRRPQPRVRPPDRGDRSGARPYAGDRRHRAGRPGRGRRASVLDAPHKIGTFRAGAAAASQIDEAQSQADHPG